jgi:hypothetical protein
VAVEAADSRVKEIRIDRASATTTGTTEDADAISADAADNADSRTYRVVVAVAQEEEAAIKVSVTAHQSHRSSPMEKQQAGSIHSVTADSFDARRTVIWRNRVTPTCRCP